MERLPSPPAHRSRRLKYWLPALLVIPLAAAAAPWLVGPECPRRIVILTGSTEGAYHAFATQYREILAEDGIELEIASTAGSIENGRQLANSGDPATIAIMQGGCRSEAVSGKSIETLASLYLEPIWIFSRKDAGINHISDLSDKRVAVGAPGSGTRSVAVQLLSECELAETDSREHSEKRKSFGGRAAVEALKAGTIDAAFFVISPNSPMIRELLSAPELSLMSFRRAAAYQKKYPFLTSVTLHEGMVDLKENLPARDITLLAPTANLVATSDLHPALVPLLLKAVTRVHESGGFLEKPGEFPSSQHADYRMNSHAKRYLKSGPKFLYRYLPFQLAAWIDRVKLMLLPLCTLLIPFVKLAPPLYRWRTRAKIYRSYDVLRDIDAELRKSTEVAVVAQSIDRLHELEAEIATIRVPLSYMQEFYNLRLHAAFMLERLQGLRAESEEPLRAAA